MIGDFARLSRDTRFSEAGLDRACSYARYLYLALTDRPLDNRIAGDLVYHAALMACTHRTDLTDAVQAEVQRLIARERARTPAIHAKAPGIS
jgi:hypothetical protein